MTLSRHTTLLAVVRLLFSAAHAANVTPAAATNYYFTTPLRPAHIRGLVMGNPPVYYVPRSEDFDWINEATTERLRLRDGASIGESVVLRPEFGKWGLSETNRFHRWVTAVDAAGVTNVVVGYHAVTNRPSSNGSPDPSFRNGFPRITTTSAAADLYNFGYRNGLLDPDVQLVTQSRTYDDTGVAFTNVYTVSYYTNVVTNAFSIIELPLTNGTVSVHTNTWSTYRGVLVSEPYTNVLAASAIDYCHVGDGMFPLYTNVPPIANVSRLNCNITDIITNDFAALRGATRLADHAVDSTNRITTVTTIYDSYGDIVTTNDDASAEWDYYFEAEHRWEDVAVNPDYYSRLWARPVPNNHVVTVPTRFDSAVVTTGGVCRVAVEAAFAAVTIHYYRYSTNNQAYESDILTYVVVPINSGRINTGGCQCTWENTIDANSVVDEAVAASGAPSLPQDMSTYDPGRNITERWQVHLNYFVLIYRIHPTSKFTDW